MNSVMNAVTLVDLGAEMGVGLGDGISSEPRACRSEKKRRGWLSCFNGLEGEMLIRFTSSFDWQAAYVVASFAFDAPVEGQVVVGSSSD